MADLTGFHDPLEHMRFYSGPDADPSLRGSRVHKVQGRVKSVKMLTHDTCELVVQYDYGNDILSPVAGQYATLKTEELSKPRSYSFARAPEKEAPGEHSFFIRKVPGGQFSEWLFGKENCVGKPIVIGGPMGKFGLDDSDRPMLCVAGGSGMSAIFAMLEHAVTRQVKRDAVFLYGAREQKDLYMLDEIKQFEKHWNGDAKFTFVPVLSEEPEDSDWTGARGFVTNYMVEQCSEKGMLPEELVAYFCGPPPMINLGVDLLLKAGVPAESIRYDKFEDATSPAPVIDNAKCVLCDECLLVKPLENCIVEVSALYPKDRRNYDGGSQQDFSGYRRVDPLETSGLYYNSLYIDENECIRCYACVDSCPAGAIDPKNDKTPKTLRRIVA